ncbi:MAG: helix-turn-helix domain-containing protein [Planctomycetes bacterium]|nr:helix-turn-helix domain-containing protein [Planctomycetota bacterium]
MPSSRSITKATGKSSRGDISGGNRTNPKKRPGTKAVRRTSRPAPAKVATRARDNDVRLLRQSLGLSRKLFSRLCHYSERAIADWESGGALGGPSQQRMLELKRLYDGLVGVIDADFVGQWLQAPNDAFDGLKPLEVIERGQMDRIWRMIYLLESGVPT